MYSKTSFPTRPRMMSDTVSTTRAVSRDGDSAIELGSRRTIHPNQRESVRKSNEFSEMALVRGISIENDAPSNAPATSTRTNGSTRCQTRTSATFQ